MCHQRHLFSHFKKILPGTRWINGIGQDRVEVLGIGNVSITPIINGDTRPFTFPDVLYAPQIGVNLVSVAALTNDESHAHFYESEAFITSQGILIMTAKRVEEALYQLNLALSTDVAMLVRSSFKRMTRKVFPDSTSQQSRIGALVVHDVCGPMQVDSIGGARYYVCCRNVFSNYRTIYFVKHKSEASDCCRAFIASVHAQTGNLVAIFRTDGGTEFLKIDPWLKRKGITHQTTCRYTPQQNAIERDNRTIVSLSRACPLSNKSLPLSLWAEAASCVVKEKATQIIKYLESHFKMRR